MNSINLKARAKINLALDIINKRPDGYHEVRMIMQTINLFDKIYIKKINKPSIIIDTNIPYIPKNKNNLMHKAATLLMEQYGISSGVYINLHKVIPVSAGLAGGSSDAAVTLIGLNKLFNLNLSYKELMAIGVQIGADIPYCIMRGTALAEGIGEQLTPLSPMPKCYVLIAKPDINVSTAQVYSMVDIDAFEKRPNVEAMIQGIEEQDLTKITNHMGNVLETVTIKKYPVINQIKEKMLEKGAIASMMSGSGPTVFGIFRDKKKAQKALYDFKLDNIGKNIFLTTIFNRKERG
ncbi:4-diphosphocytidyl-2-C-methyl-D-erythritol kinase [Natranaerovirga hydrolytica]|uniref:4-diphosphocytidyl-2-C-methyl-D-erythritol kinase n=1 Tax=Natranaerovirga hydrolytica TaxID=680378 RepID=A0A4R1ML98_9FIRM|nr:4-(cytidine 5'-diphospho)-2-C-methyl-D-erythritol kinase [Natranaerovirga hydrolytica]TCK93285.1 4-diphosphocytidyl-2-C-methyl-D-erythritol kinase [Natranaerovirga hydrolytica]